MNTPKVNPEIPPNPEVSPLIGQPYDSRMQHLNMQPYQSGPLPTQALYTQAALAAQTPNTGSPMQSPQINEVALALSKAQGEMENPAFDKKNPHFNSRYASEAAIMTAIRKPLSKHGLAISHQTINGTLITKLMHGSGQWLGTEWKLNVDSGKPQERGSERTYARRYNVCGLVGVVGDDDDDANIANKVDDKSITEEQVEQLAIIIGDMEAGTEDRLCAYMSKALGRTITALEDIPGSQFATAFAALNKKRKAAPSKEPKP